MGHIPSPTDTASASGELDATETERVAWQFHPDRRAWETAGFGDFTEARAWRDLGVTPDVAVEWRARSFIPETAAPWMAVGLRVIDAEYWRDKGTWTPKQAAQMSEMGYSVSKDSEMWLRVADGDPEKAVELLAYGFDLETVARELIAGRSLDDLLARWQHEGFGSAKDRLQWSAVLSAPAEARAWRDAQLKHSTMWCTEGFTIEEARAWEAMDYGPTSADLLRKNGLTPATAPPREP